MTNTARQTEPTAAARTAGVVPVPIDAVRGTRGYAVPRGGQPIDLALDANEKHALPDAVVRTLQDITTDTVRTYPSARRLEAILAERFGLEPDNVLATNGGDDIIDRVCRAYLEPGRSIVIPVPTFEMIERGAQLRGAETRAVAWNAAAFPTSEVLDAADETTSVVAVVSPNNPTGVAASEDDLRTLSESLPHALVMLDAAYAEYAEVDLTPLALSLPNTVVVRTLSKAYGLAGARIGFGLGSRDVIASLRAAGGPYNISSISVAIGVARLTGDTSDVTETIARVRTERDALADQLDRLGFDALRSQANFVFARSANAQWLCDALAGLGVGIRAWPNKPGLDDAVRITLPGDDDAFARLTRAIETALAPQALLFDMDGVLVDDSRSYRETIVRTCADLGVEITLDDVKAAKAAGNSNDDWELTHRLLSEHGVERSLEEVTEHFERIYQGTPEEPGLKSLEAPLISRAALERLKSKLTLGIVTGRPRTDAEEFLQREGLADLFSCVVCMHDAGALKPDPAPVREALRRLGIERAWMVGDMPDDQTAARGAGVVPIGVLGPAITPCEMTAPLTLAGASRVLARTADIETLVESVLT